MTETTAPVKKRGRPPKKASEVPVTTLRDKFEPILIHFVSDGFTALNNVWMIGQEVEVTEEAYPDVEDWIHLSDEEQIERWGQVKFRKGPSPVPNSVINYRKDFREEVKRGHFNLYNSSISSKYLESLAEKERKRGRSIPDL